MFIIKHLAKLVCLAAILGVGLVVAAGEASAAETTEDCVWDHDDYATCYVVTCYSDGDEIDCVDGTYCTNGNDSFPCPYIADTDNLAVRPTDTRPEVVAIAGPSEFMSGRGVR